MLRMKEKWRKEKIEQKKKSRKDRKENIFPLYCLVCINEKKNEDLVKLQFSNFNSIIYIFKLRTIK